MYFVYKNRKVCTVSFACLGSSSRGLRGCTLSSDRPSGPCSRSRSACRAIVFCLSLRSRSFFLDTGIVVGGFGHCSLICILRLLIIVLLESFDIDFGQRNNDSGTATAAFISFGGAFLSFLFLYTSVCFCVCTWRTLQFGGQKFTVSLVILS